MTIYNDTGHCEHMNKGTSYSKSIPNLNQNSSILLFSTQHVIVKNMFCYD